MAAMPMLRLSSSRARVFTLVAGVLVPLGQFVLIIRPWPLSTAMEVIFGAMFIAGLLLAMLVVVGTPGWRREAKGMLDEREAGEAAGVLSLSYRIIGVLLAALLLWYSLATVENSLGLIPPAPRVMRLLLLNLFWLQLVLPSAILAWRDREIEED